MNAASDSAAASPGLETDAVHGSQQLQRTSIATFRSTVVRIILINVFLSPWQVRAITAVVRVSRHRGSVGRQESFQKVRDALCLEKRRC